MFGSLILAGGLLLAAIPQAPEFPLEAYRLPNGLKVALHHDPSVPRVTVCVAYHVGSKNERPGRTGFAHFFEHMMFRGTAHVPNYDIPLQEAGASSNAFTSEDMTVYFETVPSNFLERALYLEAERLAHLDSALNQDKFDTEREVVKNERRQSFENVPYGLAEETIAAHLFPSGHPYSWSVIGSMRDLNAASLDDLKAFFAEFYHPGNATLCLAGDFDPQLAKRWIAHYFEPLAAGPAVARVATAAIPHTTARLTQLDRVEVPRIYWTWPTVNSEHADAPALDLLAMLLTDGEASRLYRTLVRDRQLATDVEASSDTREIAGLFSLKATAAEGQSCASIEAAFQEELQRLQQEPPQAEELARALARFEKSMYAQLTSPFARAVTLALGFAQYNDPAHYRQDFVRYFRVTPTDIQRVAQTYLVDQKVALLVRPVEPGEAESQAVEVGPAAAVAGPSSRPAPRAAADGPDWSQMPDPADEPVFAPPQATRRRLASGLELWIVPWRTLPVVECELLIPVGTADDPDGKAGLATLTAALWDKGTQELSAIEFAEALDGLGTSAGVACGLDETTVSFSTLQRNLAPTLELIGGMLMRPQFAPEEFEREQHLQLNELLQGRANPQWVAGRVLRSLAYGPHPYGRPAQGYEASVAALTVDDVRGFYERFGAQGARLIVVGDVEPEALVRLVETSWSSWVRKAAIQERPAITAQPDPGILYLADQPGAVQSVLFVGRRWAKRDDPRYCATLVGNRILGDDFLSRLNQNLRERNGYTYGARSRFNYHRLGSLWAVNTSVRGDATAPAVQEILSELQGVAGNRPFTADEIAVNRIGELRNFPDQFDSPTAIADVFSELVRLGLPDDELATFRQRLDALDAAAIQQCMADLVAAEERIHLVVGDRQQIEPELRKLPFREIRYVNSDGAIVAGK